ncbi:hypothetical protein GCM10020331_044140 [Ectobacillus funiculus]
MPGLTSALRDQMAAAGLKEWDWTIDSLDWKLANNPNGIVQKCSYTIKQKFGGYSSS